MGNVKSRIDGSFWRHQWFHKNSFKNKKSERKEKEKEISASYHFTVKNKSLFLLAATTGSSTVLQGYTTFKRDFHFTCICFCAKEKETVTDQNEQMFDYYTFHNSSGTLLNKCKFSAQSKMVAILIFLYTVACSVPVRDIPQVSPLVREFKVLDSGFQAMDSRFQVHDSTIFHSGFQSLLWDSGFFELFLDTKVQDPGFHKEKLAGLRNPDSLTWGDRFLFLEVTY